MKIYFLMVTSVTNQGWDTEFAVKIYDCGNIPTCPFIGKLFQMVPFVFQLHFLGGGGECTPKTSVRVRILVSYSRRKKRMKQV
jgi:hypothetical protein